MSGSGGKRHHSVIKPGYHLHPKNDLVYLRRKRHGHGGKKMAIPELPLVSMIDMFTILVIFLLMNFSATGEIFFIPKEVKLPDAKHTHPIESAPLITVTEKEVILETEPVGENPITVTESDVNLPRLAAALKKVKELMLQTHPDQPFKGSVNIQADEKTPLIYIKRVMQTCIAEGWSTINFAVQGVQEGGGGGAH